MSLPRAIATVGGLTLLSRIAGFVRDTLTANLIGAGPVADAFFVALKLPNFLRKLFAEGAFSVSFVPLFSAELQKHGKGAATGFAEQALAVMATVLVPLTVLAVWGMPWVLRVLAPGFVGRPETFALAVDLARATFPYLMLISLAALLGGVLNAVERFGPFAATPIAFNLVLIATLAAAPRLGLEPGRAMAWAVSGAGIVQLVWLALACNAAGFALRLPRPAPTPQLRRLFVLMAPGLLGVGVMQVSLLVNIMIASLLPAGAISTLYYADRLNQLPLGVIGAALGTALLPVLSRRIAAGDGAGSAWFLNRGLETGLLLGLPAAVALGVSAHPIARAVYEHGAFGPAATAATGAALSAYALGIPAFVVAKVLGAAFFARQDTATPVAAAILSTTVNAGLGWALSRRFGPAGIALATGLAAWLHAAVLAAVLARRGRLALDGRLVRRGRGIVLASAGMGALLHVLGPLLDPWMGGPALLRAAALAGLVGAGLLSYFALALLAGGADATEARGLLKRTPAGPPPLA